MVHTAHHSFVVLGGERNKARGNDAEVAQPRRLEQLFRGHGDFESALGKIAGPQILRGIKSSARAQGGEHSPAESCRNPRRRFPPVDRMQCDATAPRCRTSRPRFDRPSLPYGFRFRPKEAMKKVACYKVARTFAERSVRRRPRFPQQRRNCRGEKLLRPCRNSPQAARRCARTVAPGRFHGGYLSL